MSLLRAGVKTALALAAILTIAACETPPPAAKQRPASAPSDQNTAPALDTASLQKAEPVATALPKITPAIQPCNPIHISDNNATLAPYEVRRIQSAIEACWRPLKGAPFDQNLKVILGVNLDIDGNLIGNPDIIQAPDPVAAGEFSEASLARARQALDACLPFELPKEKYVAWCRMELAFDPKKLN